jgi:hypothetical protein
MAQGVMAQGYGADEEEIMTKFAQRALISGAAALAIMSGTGGVDLLGEARADVPQCDNVTELCQPQATKGPQQLHMVRICQPAGPKAGASCREVPTRAA